MWLMPYVWTFCSSWIGHTCKVSHRSVQPLQRRFLKVFLVHERQPEWPLYSLCLCVCLSVQSTTLWDVIRFGWNLNMMLISMPSFVFLAMGIHAHCERSHAHLYFFLFFFSKFPLEKLCALAICTTYKKFSLIRSILREKIGFEEMGGDR